MDYIEYLLRSYGRYYYNASHKIYRCATSSTRGIRPWNYWYMPYNIQACTSNQFYIYSSCMYVCLSQQKWRWKADLYTSSYRWRKGLKVKYRTSSCGWNLQHSQQTSWHTLTPVNSNFYTALWLTMGLLHQIILVSVLSLMLCMVTTFVWWSSYIL